MIDVYLPELEGFTVSDPAPVSLAYVEWALDPVTWDLAVPIAFLRGAEAVVQRIKVRFRFFRGEWFLDTRLGVPYYRDILIKNPDSRVITSIFKQVLLTTPGVKSIESFRASLDRTTRKLTAYFEATLDDGTVIKANNEPFIIGS